MTSAPHQSHLLIIEDDKGRREYTLDSPVYSIGRDPKCDIRLISQFVSRRHATLVQLPNEDGTYYYRIVDGNLKGKPSANGLLINGRKLQAHDLHDQDQVIFGPQVQAIYYLLKRDAITTIPPDEYDITLISPNMTGDPEDDTASSRPKRAEKTADQTTQKFTPESLSDAVLANGSVLANEEDLEDA